MNRMDEVTMETRLTRKGLEEMFSEIKENAATLEGMCRSDHTAYLAVFGAMAKETGKRHDLDLGDFVDDYTERYLENLDERKEFMEQWGYGQGVPFKRSRGVSVYGFIGMGLGFLAGVAFGSGLFVGLAYSSLFFGSTLMMPGFVLGSLFEDRWQKKTKEFNRAVQSTTGYLEMAQFEIRSRVRARCYIDEILSPTPKD